MALVDWIAVGNEPTEGGQGIVRKVKHQLNGRIGALKTLHPMEVEPTLRRYRFMNEVSSLKVLDGYGTPSVIEANEEYWREKEVVLYLVMDFIEGKTLKKLVDSSRPTLDQAINTTKKIVELLGRVHQLDIHHRDIKPENIMMRNGSWDDPVLVDLGIAWRRDDAQNKFNTPVAQEIGNRFLRVPEHAPQGDHRDARSDLTMAAGLLYFMLSQEYPRVLLDEQGRLPHERSRSRFESSVTSDSRWRSLKSFFHVSFQTGIDLRYKSAEEVLAALSRVSEGPSMTESDLQDEIKKLKEVLESTAIRDRDAVAPALKKSSKALASALDEYWKQAGLMGWMVHPTLTDGGTAFVIQGKITRQGHEYPFVYLRHNLNLLNGRLIGSWQLDEEQSETYYEGSAADSVGVEEALVGKSSEIARAVIRLLTEKLQTPVK